LKNFLRSHDGTCKGAALIIVLAFVMLVTALGLSYFSRTTTHRQLAVSSYNDTSADMLARSALDIAVNDFKQEIINDNNNGPVNANNIQPARYPAGIPNDNPNLIRYSSRNAAASRASTVSSTAASANGRSISLARWNSHYLIPPNSATGTDSTPVGSFVAPDWVLVTGQGPASAPTPNAVIGRYAFAVYEEGGLIDVNLGGFPTYANLSRPTRPARRLVPKYPVEESEIMLAACQPPGFSPATINKTITAGVQWSFTPNTNHSPTSFTVSPLPLPHGITFDTGTGNFSGVPNSPGFFTINLTATNACGSGTAVLSLTVQGLVSPDSTPWPVNLARKGTLAFGDLTALPSTPTALTPTTTVGNMGNFLSNNQNQINKLMGWRNYATTQQSGASFTSPSFPLASADKFASNFLGAAYPLITSFTTVSNAVQNNRTDQAAMSRQELIKLQRTLDNPTGTFPQSLLQYLGTFSRELNRPAPDWPNGSNLTARFDMTNVQAVIPGFRIRHGNGHGHQYGVNKQSQLGQLFGLIWVDGTFVPGARFTDPAYYGHWRYFPHDVNQLPDNPDFFQIINYALKQGNGGISDPNTVFKLGAALIDQYDADDLDDKEDPNIPNGGVGNNITIIDYGGASYAYGIEGTSYDDPTINLARPPFAPNPASLGVPNYVILNRRFENVGEFGYAYKPTSTLASKTLDFFSAASPDRALLDFFTYNEASPRAGIVNLNTRNGPVLASIISGAWLRDQTFENPPPDATYVVSRSDALAAAQAIVQETTSTTPGRGPALNRADVTRLAAAAVAAAPLTIGASDLTKNAIARALAEVGQTRTWNLMIDVIAQTGQYTPGTADLTDPSKFIVQGEKRYWLHIALDRDNGTVLGTQLEQVVD